MPPFSISSENTHHTMIVAILILEHTCLNYASLSAPTLSEALNKAHSQYIISSTYNNIINQFSASSENYSSTQFLDFILENHL